ncbi:hypothetical protein [Paenibacillus qinlingensis]|uniref:Uncharacterized protein n=1 Tax=Paenibacillus qinlingensis TaxID=1837343 RepID=A0ABU1NYS1_9BACL|nr:hypothetical protein [Paenibacillus qinlingensis]MDR6552216.1 hypothetical protein [Paenibacillus qinlingensis]
MAEMTDREFLSAILGRINEIGAIVTVMNDRLEIMDRRLGRVEDSVQEVKQIQTQQGEQIAGIAVTTMMEHAASIRTLKLVK